MTFTIVGIKTVNFDILFKFDNLIVKLTIKQIRKKYNIYDCQ